MSVEGLEASEVDVYPGPKQSMKRKWEQVTEIPVSLEGIVTSCAVFY